MLSRIHRLDAFQRRHPAVGFPIGVIYKYIDDQGHYLAAALTYYAFVAIFPLLLIASSLLGFLLQGNEELQQTLLDSALSQFPVVGSQLGRPDGLEGSASAVVVGAAAALYGVTGLGQAAQNALNVAWAVPRNSRYNPLMSRMRSFGMLVLAGFAVLLVTVLTGFVSNLGPLIDVGAWLQLLTALLSTAVTALVISVMMRFATARRPSFRTTLPGAVLVAVAWHALQLLGGTYVRGVVAAASEMNSIFALVLGLVALIYLASVVAVLGLEVNVVLNRRLFPRALLTPFTDAVELTDADRRAYRSYAQAQRHKGFERVEVSFEDRDPAE